MINKRQWRNIGKRGFKVKDDLDKSFRLLCGVTNPAGCSVCGNDELDNLGIHPHDSNENEWRILCDRCHSATRQYFDNGLQKQIGGSCV